MRKIIHGRLFLFPLLLVQLTICSCSTLLKSKINKKFPEVSPYERKVQNIIRSSFELSQVDTASVGLHVPNEKIKTTLLIELKRQRKFDVSGMDSAVLDTNSIRIFLDRQEIELEASATVYPSKSSILKQIKSFQFNFRGFISPYFTTSAIELKDTLHLNPNVEHLRISKIKTRNFFLGALSQLAENIVNDVAKTFIKNINGLIPEAKTEVDFSLIYQKKYSELIGTVEEINIIRDDDIIINKKFGNKCILIESQGLTILSDITEVNPVPLLATSLSLEDRRRNVRQVVDRHLTGKNIAFTSHLKTEDEIKRKAFNQMFEEYKVNFTNVWNQSLDSLQKIDHSKLTAQISQKFMVSFVNQTFSNPVFAFNINPQPINATFDKVKIQILEQPKWDCNQIKFHCDTKDCREVLSDCGGKCKWYQADCHIRKAACHALNGVKYTYCTAANAAKLTACGVAYAGEKAYCFAKYALLLAAHKALTVGYIDGNVEGSIRGSGQLGRFGFSNDFNSFFLNTSQISGSGNFNARINYSKDIETAFLSILQCNCYGVPDLPIGCTFNFNGLTGNFVFPEQISGTINRENPEGTHNARIVFKTNELGIDAKFDKTPFEAMLENPNYLLSCQMIFGITALYGITQKIFNFDGKIREHYETVFKGLYTYKVKPQEFKVDISPFLLRFPNMDETAVLNSSWGKNSLTFKEQ